MQGLAVPRGKETGPIRSDTRRRVKSSTASLQSAAPKNGLNVPRRAPSGHRPPISENERRSRFMAIAVTVMANLIAGALIIYVAIYLAGNVRWADSMRSAPVGDLVSRTPRDAGTLPVLSSPARLEVTAGEKTAFPISLDGTDGVPLRSGIVVRGLPTGAALSEGRLVEGSWNLRSDEIGDLRLIVPYLPAGNVDLDVELTAPDGRVIAAVETMLVVSAIPETALSSHQDATKTEAKPQLATLPTDSPQALEPESGPGTASQPDTETPSENDSPASAANQAANQDNDATWTAVAFVNLRADPNSSARVLGVVAKGAKIDVVERKKGWLRVTTENSKTGWVYSGFVRSPSGVVHVGRKKSTSPDSPSGSLWQNWAGWLTNP